ncbi:citrate lyase subunit alpha [Tissierella sp. Yu-01]|uniref:citrate lyase subunit alpha n=1 Tax=Tissierella sp. Yu-01 TaxID=3035694 RepID=UPI00240DBCC1|nr:citrate lyase subunit alpha [Tissierella sp. Yu-01]WFA08128.1 citrate lyase subunit alpha [Tissierella sp. Yu-01]
MVKNGIGREIPEFIEGYGEVKPYVSPFDMVPTGSKAGAKLKRPLPHKSKMIESVEEAIKATGLKDGMTISFHHHFRNGDYIVNMVVEAIANLGIKDIRIASSSLTTCHAPLIDHIKNGVITGIETSGLRDPLGSAISEGILPRPVVIRSHGGRARAVESGELKIDVAFLGVPACDEYGNANGYSGKSACGSLGYAMVDAKYADQVVLITDNIVEYPCLPASINQTQVDYVVEVEAIGDPKGIVSGAIKGTKNPRDILIAENAVKAILASGYFKNGFSYQTGAAGSSLAVTEILRQHMIEQNIVGSFGLGGITSQLVQLLEEGLFKGLFDTQCFDLVAAESIGKNPNHFEIDASFYANPHNAGPVVNKLDIVMLGALEVDTDFNVNVITGSDGVISQASGGHSDTAAGSKMSVILAPLMRSRIPIVVDKVTTVVTPGETVDVLVTDYGIAVNPLRTDLIENFKKANLPLYTISELKDMAEKLTGKPEPIEFTDKVVGVVEYRDGTVIDVIRQAK